MILVYMSMLDSKEDENKFEHLYYTYKSLMYTVAYGILKDEMFAENAVSEAFMRIASNFSKISEVDCPQTKGFVVVIVKNTAISIYNQNKKNTDVSFDEIEGCISYSRNAEDEAFDKFDSDSIKNAIKSLKPMYFEVISLYYGMGYSTSEISKLLGENVETIKKRIQRAKNQLYKIIEKEEIL